MDSNTTFAPNVGMGMPYAFPNNNYMGVAVTKHNNNLSDEEIKSLRTRGPEFSLGLTQDEILRSGCNHREIGGSADSLYQDPNTGEVVCTICGEHFHLIEDTISDETVKNITDNMVDLLNTIKVLYYDLPSSPAREYFTILPLIKKAPQLYKLACESMAKHDVNCSWRMNGNMPGAMSMLQNMNSMFGNGGFGMGMMQAPVGAFPQQPMFQQQSMMQQPAYPGFGYPGAGQPQPTYQPQPTNVYQPNVVNNVAPAAAEVTKTVTA